MAQARVNIDLGPDSIFPERLLENHPVVAKDIQSTDMNIRRRETIMRHATVEGWEQRRLDIGSERANDVLDRVPAQRRVVLVYVSRLPLFFIPGRHNVLDQQERDRDERAGQWRPEIAIGGKLREHGSHGPTGRDAADDEACRGIGAELRCVASEPHQGVPRILHGRGEWELWRQTIRRRHHHGSELQCEFSSRPCHVLHVAAAEPSSME